MPKVGFVSLGCPKNLVDSEVMMGILARSGYEITARPGDADVLVVNTCSFIAPAQQESVQSILEMAEYKKFGRAQKLIVAGCMVEQFPQRDSGADSGSGRGDRYRRSGKNPGSLRRRAAHARTPRPPARQPISTTISRRASWRRRATRHTSRSTKAATIRAASASSRSFAANSAAADSNPWSAKRRTWPRRASAKSP